MTHTDMLAQLVSDAETGGLDRSALRALIEESSEAGAQRALSQLGLADPQAHKDMADLRELLSAWRDAKRSAGKAAIGWLVRAALALLVIGLAVKLGLGNLVMQ